MGDREENVVNQFVCRYCNRPFQTNQQLQRHEDTHKGTKYPCQLCDKQFSSASNLTRHKSQQHGPVNKQTNTMMSLGGKEYYCGECGRFFAVNQEREYYRHLDEHMTK